MKFSNLLYRMLFKIYATKMAFFYIHIYNIGFEFTYFVKIEFSIGERKTSKKSV